MKIIDTNILNGFVKGDVLLDASDEFYTTEVLKEEIENLKTMSSDYNNKIQQIKFSDIETHRYFNEAKYLENYKFFLNKYSKITSFYGLKGLGDISIIASVATILNPTNPTLFDQTNDIEVMTHDDDLKEALQTEFDGRININDPLNL